jgi:DHA1 family bicyclomycin/chloramphenicol resistance-like MFS transporter
MVRDRFSGAAMARINSLSMSVMMIVPMLAPSLGQLVLLDGSWRAVFVVLAGAKLTLLLWTWLRAPETLAPDRWRGLSLASVRQGLGIVFGNATASRYVAAIAILQGAMFGYLNSVEPIYVGLFGVGTWFPVLFGTTAIFMAAASYANSRIVVRHGARRISRLALAAFTGLSLVHAAIAFSGTETVVSFALLQALATASSSLVGANFSALAMERMGAVAGTAAGVQGAIQSAGGAAIGIAVGQMFDGGTVPLASAYL